MGDPSGNRAAGGFKQPGRNGLATADVGKVGAGRSPGCGPAYGVAGRALPGHKRLLSSTRLVVRRRRGALPLQAHPFIEDALFFSNHKERHVGMLQTAEFGTLAAIDASTLGTDREFVRASGDKILLPGKTRDPERMNDIQTFQLQAHLASDRDMNFVCGLKTLVRR